MPAGAVSLSPGNSLRKHISGSIPRGRMEPRAGERRSFQGASRRRRAPLNVNKERQPFKCYPSNVPLSSRTGPAGKGLSKEGSAAKPLGTQPTCNPYAAPPPRDAGSARKELGSTFPNLSPCRPPSSGPCRFPARSDPFYSV